MIKIVKKHPLYKTWSGIKTRCGNRNSHAYKNYGGRGIVMCDRWRKDFWAFVKDVGERPEGTTLDRIDTNGNYEPGNVRWATWEMQMNNSRANTVLTVRGEKLTIAQASRKYCIGHSTICQRLYKHGWPEEMAVTHPIRKRSQEC